MWLEHEDLASVISDNWIQPTGLSGVMKFWVKQKRLKECLKKWNREVFGNIFSAVQQVEEDLQHFELMCETLNSDANKENLAKAKEDHD